MEKKSILIDKVLHHQLKIYCVNNDLKLKDYVENLIRNNIGVDNATVPAADS